MVVDVGVVVVTIVVLVVVVVGALVVVDVGSGAPRLHNENQ